MLSTTLSSLSLFNLCFVLCSLMAEWRFSRGVEGQTKAFLDGFNEVVPLQWLQYFDEKELEVSWVSDWDMFNPVQNTSLCLFHLLFYLLVLMRLSRWCCVACRRWICRTGRGTQSTDTTPGTANRSSGSGRWGFTPERAHVGYAQSVVTVTHILLCVCVFVSVSSVIQLVKEVDNEVRLRLMQFVTGTCRLPLGGFAELMGQWGDKQIFIFITLQTVSTTFGV